MRVSILTEQGDIHTIEVDSQMELENIKALLEADCNIPAEEQILLHNNVELRDPKSTLEGNNVGPDEILSLHRRTKKPRTQIATVGGPGQGSSARSGHISQTTGDPHNAEQLRQHIINDPVTLRQLRESQPELANAAQNDPNRFHEMIRELNVQRRSAETARIQEINALNADPFDLEAQRRIEEAIRMENVAANMEAAMEHNPESFGRVTMLYIDVEVNGQPVKAFVDSGAQATIMSPRCAEACGIMRLVDRRFAGVARGVGVAKILGRVHSAQIRVGRDLFLQCAFTIMEGKGVDLLFGLDMLKRHQASIDLKKDCLIINGTDVPFLSEHELPDHARDEAALSAEELEMIKKSEDETLGASSSASSSAIPTPAAPVATTDSSSFSTSVAAPTTIPPSAAPTAPRTQASNPQPQVSLAPSTESSHSEENIQTLMALGASREEVIAALDAAAGNVDQAASFLF